MSEPSAPFRPIGFWVKLVDGLLEDGLAACLEAEGMSRREWQVMNLVGDGGADEGDVIAALAPFEGGGGQSVGAVIADLVGRGWLQASAGRLAMTRTGVDALMRAAAEVATFRGVVANDVDREDYERTVAVLTLMATNLGW